MNDYSTSKSEKFQDSVLTVMLAEYSSLRSESLEAIKSRVAIANLMFATITLVFSAVASGKISTPYDAIIAIIIAPQFLRAAMWIALGEYHRSQRAGHYLCELEKRINNNLSLILNNDVPEHRNNDALQWESFLKQQGKHMINSYKFTGILTLIMIWASNIFGICKLYISFPEQMFVIFILIIVLVILEIIFFKKTSAAWNNARHHNETSASL